MAMRSIGSISSELCEMQRLRDSNIALTAKDLEWQRRIIASPSPSSVPVPAPAPAPASAPAPAFASPRRAYPPSEPAPPASYLPRDPRFALFTTSPKPPAPAFHPFVVPLPRPQHPASAPASAPAPAPTPVKTEDDTAASDDDATHHPDRGLPHSQRDRSPDPTTTTPSASTHGASPDLDAGERRLGDGQRARKSSTSNGRIGKIRRHRMTKEEEARFNPADLKDLRGSTAAKSRKMTEEERDIMLHKRRLRNRLSAAKSRDKQRKTIGDVGEEVDDLLEISKALQIRCEAAERDVDALRLANHALRQENAQLRNTAQAPVNAALAQQPGVLRRAGSTLRFSMSSDMLDKIISGSDGAGLLSASAASSGMLKIPSTLHLSLSTDKLADGMQAFNASLQPMSRTASILEKLLDYNNNDQCNPNGEHIANNPTTSSSTTKLG